MEALIIEIKGQNTLKFNTSPDFKTFLHEAILNV